MEENASEEANTINPYKMTAGKLNPVLLNIFVASAYVLGGLIGYALALPNGNVSLVWPPSGIAMAAVLMLGCRTLPGLFIGAALINGYALFGGPDASFQFITGAAVIVISIGSILQPIAGRYLINRFGNPEDPFADIETILKSGFLFAVVCLVSSSMGTLALSVSGLIFDNVASVFATWWIGDFIGILTFTPLMFAWVRQSRFIGLGLVAIVLISFGSTYFFSNYLRSQAEEVWDNRATREAERLTTTLISWIELSASPVNAMSSLIKGSEKVDGAEFLEASTQLEDYQPDFFPRTLSVLEAAGTSNQPAIWKVVHSTDNSGPFAKGETVTEQDMGGKAINEALDNPDRLIIGEFGSLGGHSIVIAAVAISSGGHDKIVIGAIDLDQMADGLFALQVPEGFHLHIFGAASGSDADNYVPIYGHGHGTEKIIDTKSIRTVARNAQLNFHWVITDRFLPGSRDGMANAVIIGGIFGSALLILVFTFILGQNEQIRRRVEERTSELTKQKTILETTMEAMEQGLTMFDRDFTLTARNSEFMRMFDLPVDLFPVGTHFSEMLRFNAERGDYGEGDVEAMVQDRLALAAKYEPHRLERTLPNGKTIEIRGNPLPDMSGFVTTYTDISDRKKAEQDIADKEALLRMALENMPGGIAMVDSDMKIQLFNDTYRELYGHPPGSYGVGTHIGDVIRMNVENGIHSAGDHISGDIEETVKRRLDAFRSGKAGESEREMADGRTLHIRHNPLENGGVVLVATDITARRKAEVAIARQEAQIRAIVESVPDVVVTIDQNGIIQTVNRAAESVFGYQADAMIGQKVDMLMPKDIAIHHDKYLQSYIETGDARFIGKGPRELKGLRKSGEIFPIDISVAEARIDGMRLFVGVLRDITARKEAERVIAEKEAQLRAIIDNIKMVIILKDRLGRHLAVNNYYEEATGVSPDSVIGKRDDEFLPSDVAQEIMNMDKRVFESGEVYTFEETVPHPDGTLHFYLTTKAPVFDQNGNVDTIVIAALDITERKKIQEEIAEKESQLRMALENMPGAMIVLDQDLKVLLVNETYKDYYGDPLGIVKPGTSMADIIRSEAERGVLTGTGEDSTEDIIRYRVDAYQDRMPLNIIDRAQDGRHIRLARKPVEGGYTICVAVDITDLKQTERELAQKEAMLTAALENMTGGLFMIDVNMNLRVFNERFAEFYEFPKEILKVDNPLADVLRVRAERGDYGEGDPEELVQKRLAGYRNRDVQIVIDKVGERLIEVYRAPMDDGGMVCVFNDVTERKQAEEALSKAHSLITESLSYASRIQRSLLPPKTILDEVFKSHAMIWEPKDMVGGDMIWLRPGAGGFYLIVADCTGHGPPGAFMTMICTGALDQSLAEMDDADPAKVLHLMNKKIKAALGQDSEGGESDDGVELGICHIDEKSKKITFAGARFILVVVEGKTLQEIKGNKSAIGYRHVRSDIQFDNNIVKYKPGMQFYMWSDGIVDQIGGPKRLSFGKRRLRNIVLDYHQMDMSWQRSQILREFQEYQHDELRRDDITLFGFIPR